MRINWVHIMKVRQWVMRFFFWCRSSCIQCIAIILASTSCKLMISTVYAGVCSRLSPSPRHPSLLSRHTRTPRFVSHYTLYYQTWLQTTLFYLTHGCCASFSRLLNWKSTTTPLPRDSEMRAWTQKGERLQQQNCTGYLYMWTKK